MRKTFNTKNYYHKFYIGTVEGVVISLLINKYELIAKFCKFIKKCKYNKSVFRSSLLIRKSILIQAQFGQNFLRVSCP